MFAQIASWDNLLLAYHDAALGKRRKAAAAGFEHQLADHLAELQSELVAQTYRPGAYRHFIIQEHKRRKISAAPFRDRVVHHALCNLIQPHFERRFIANSFANRVGKGAHRAVDCFQTYARQYKFVLRLDIVEHFPSLDHAVLRAAIQAVVSEADVLGLVDAILASGVGVLADEYTPVLFPGDDLFALGRPRGLPIGNLTSQFWSNVYMHALDAFVTRELGCSAYLRYVDDVALFSNDKRELYAWKQASIERLAQLRLTIHEAEAQAMPVACGIPWLGFVVYPAYRLLKKRNVVNFSRRLAHNLDLFRAGRISYAELDASVQGWIAHVDFGDTWGLRKHIFGAHPIPRPPTPA
jgi:hypothetical protein